MELVTTESGTVLAVERRGPAGDAGLPIVLVAGWCCDRASVAPLVTDLSRRHPVIVVDLPGHGGSPAAAGHVGAVSVASLAADVLGVIDALRIAPCVVAGHSMGALVALVCASRPDLVVGSVLLDPAPVLAQRGKDFFGRSALEVAADADGAWRRRFAERLIPRADVPGRDEVIDGFARFPTDLAAAECRAIAEADGRAALGAVRVPVLLVTAGPPEAEVLDQLRSVVLGRVVGSGHFVQLEAPDQVSAMIEAFLRVSLGR